MKENMIQKKIVAYLEKHNIIEKGGQMWGPTLTAYSHIEPNRMLPEEFQNLEEMYSTLEYLHYTKKLSIQDIFTYAKIQIQCSKIDDRDTVGRNPEISYITILKYLGHYNHLCDESGWKDSLPDSLISSDVSFVREISLVIIMESLFCVGLVLE